MYINECYYKVGQFFYYKMRQTVLQSGAALFLQSEASSITK